MSDELASLLAQLADESRPVRSLNLTHISDLSRDQVAQFRLVCDSLGPARRLDLVTAMIEQAEANIHLNFHAILRSCLGEVDDRIRKLAIEGLWEDERASLVQPLASLLADDPASEVRAAAAISLSRFVLLGVLGEIAEEPARTAEEALWLAWRRAGEPVEVRRRALEGLACTDAPGLHDLVRGAYYHEDAHMRQSALFAMGRSADPRWSRVVLAELASREPAMRFEAAVAAGEMTLRSATQPLIRALDDPDANVREAAVLALGKIGGASARRALQALVEGDDERLAEAAEEALDELTFNSDRLDGQKYGPFYDVLLDYSGKSSHRRGRAEDLMDDGDLSDDDEETFDELEWDGEAEDDDEAKDDLEEDDLNWDEDWEEDDPVGGRRIRDQW
jgi:HEAT repeat protein